MLVKCVQEAADLGSKEKIACSPESRLLYLLFREFKDKGIRYAVMRNYDSLPASVSGSDLDILIYPEDEEKAKEVFWGVLSSIDGFAIGVGESLHFQKIFAIGPAERHSVGWWGLRLDVSYGIYYAGIAQLIDTKHSIKKMHKNNDIVVLEPGTSAVLGVLKEVLHNNELPRRYLTTATEALNFQWKELETEFAPMGRDALALLKGICQANVQQEQMPVARKKIRRAILYNALVNKPIKYLKGRIVFEWYRARRLVRPPGMMVAILGTDGSGKSTVISAVKPVLDAATHGDLKVKHLRPGLLPPLSRFKGKALVQEGVTVDPHSSQVSGTVGSIVRLLYLITDYIIGYWTIVRPKIARSPTIFLFDRYAYDLAMDPRRFRIRLPGWLLNLAAKLAPTPDLIFCLDADPEEIYQRKKELPLQEVKRQVQFLRDFAKHHPRAVLVSTSGTVEESRDHFFEALRQYCVTRNPPEILS